MRGVAGRCWAWCDSPLKDKATCTWCKQHGLVPGKASDLVGRAPPRGWPSPSSSCSISFLWVMGLRQSSTMMIRLQVRAVEMTCGGVGWGGVGMGVGDGGQAQSEGREGRAGLAGSTCERQTAAVASLACRARGAQLCC